MKKIEQAFTLVEIMIVAIVIALLTAVAIPNLLRAKITGNQSSAQATLKSIATALEAYSIANGIYPSATTSLMGAAPPYLTKDYFASPFNGYNFTASITDYTYAVTAVPAGSNQGSESYTITTGGVLTVN